MENGGGESQICLVGEVRIKPLQNFKVTLVRVIKFQEFSLDLYLCHSTVLMSDRGHFISSEIHPGVPSLIEKTVSAFPQDHSC